MKVEIELIDSVAKRLRKIASESGLSVEDVVKVATVQFVGVPTIPTVLSPYHVYWPGFIEVLADRVININKDGQFVRCGGNFNETLNLLTIYKRFGVSPNLTIDFFIGNGIFCDCSLIEFSNFFRLSP